MNNPNNSNRLVINLDGGLDDLDDDDITLPSLPAQTVPIVDASDSVASSNTEKSDAEKSDAEKSNTADIALGTPIVEIEKQSSSENTLESTVETATGAVNTNKAALPSQPTTTIPTMPLQDHLGDRPSATSATSDTSAINKAQTEIQQLSAAT